MGQAMSSETLSISGGDGYRYWVGISMKPFGKGCKKTVFKGVLLGSGPRQWEKVIAKAFTDIPGTKETWSHEVNKADLTRQLAASFLQIHRSVCKISVVIPGIVQMDKVSKANNWFASKSGLRGLGRSEWISVEEFIPGRINRFCVWRDEHTQDIKESDHLQTFSHFTYKHSCGTLVACDFQGTCDTRASLAHYTFTDSIIHSSAKIYGLFDKGEYGITEFFKRHKCNAICRDWPRPTPLTPPPSFDQACALQLRLTPPPAFENVVFPSHQVRQEDTQPQGDALNDSINRRRRHASAHASRTNRDSSSNTLQVSDIPRRRRSVGSMSHPNMLGAPRECIPMSPAPAPDGSPSQPPSYHSVFGPDLRRRSATFNGFEPQTTTMDSPSVSSAGLGADQAARHTTRWSAHTSGQISNTDQASPRHKHTSLAVTLSDPEARLRGCRASSPRGQGHLSVANTPSNENLAPSTAVSSALMRRRMLSQQVQDSGGEDADMVAFYLGELEADLPPLRVTPSAPPLPEDACFSEG